MFERAACELVVSNLLAETPINLNAEGYEFVKKIADTSHLEIAFIELNITW